MIRGACIRCARWLRRLGTDLFYVGAPLATPNTFKACVCITVCVMARGSWLQDFQADVITTRVAVPEGSSSVRVDAGRLAASVADERTFTYLDTHIGRPTKVITTRRMTSDDRDAHVHVSYKFSPLYALLEPALLCAVFATLFAVVLGASRLDLTIVRGAAWRAEQVRRARCAPPCCVLGGLGTAAVCTVVGSGMRRAAAATLGVGMGVDPRGTLSAGAAPVQLEGMCIDGRSDTRQRMLAATTRMGRRSAVVMLTCVQSSNVLNFTVQRQEMSVS